MLGALTGLWRAYEQQLATRPIPTQMASSAVLWAIGDYLAQRIAHAEEAAYGPSNTNLTQQPQQAAMQPQQQSQGPQQLPQQQQHQHQHQHQQGQSLHAGNPSNSSSSNSSSSSSFCLDERRLLLTSAFGAGFIGPVGHMWYEGIERVCRRLVPQGGVRFLATKVVLDSAIMGSVYVVAFFAFIATVLEGTGLAGFTQKMQVDFIPTYAAELAFWPVVQTLNFSQVPVRHQLLVVNSFSLLDAAFISWVGNQSDWLSKITSRLGIGPDDGTKQA